MVFVLVPKLVTTSKRDGNIMALTLVSKPQRHEKEFLHLRNLPRNTWLHEKHAAARFPLRMRMTHPACTLPLVEAGPGVHLRRQQTPIDQL